ncbi:FtsX-like permease family protein [Spirillospora sp. NPDC047279]|uniref:FtsX-like permease family protein n=1 Tax=Spirillospora sp. NPDC047279 TaxID=3155478 RepID=UPI0033D52FF1
MRGRGSGYAVALRVARRDALRSKGRSTLVLAMIGLPVMAIVAASVLFTTGDWSPRESLPYDLGRADARIGDAGRKPVQQDVDDRAFTAGGSGEVGGEPWTTAEITQRVRAKYGPGAKVLQYSEGTSIAFRTERGILRADVTETDLRDPLASGLLRVVRGRAPATPGEVAVSDGFTGRGFAIGATAVSDRDGSRKRVVGVVEDPRAPRTELMTALPGAFAGTAGPGGAEGGRRWLIGVGGPVTWADVLEFNKSGLTVLSRAVVTDPPPPGEVPLGGAAADSAARSATLAVGAMIVAMIVLEVVLLAGPAFAVGVHRQRRQLALVAAAGGDPRHLRAVVLAGGVVIGAVAALLGAALGIGLAAAARPLFELRTGEIMGPFEVPWLLVAAPMLLGGLSGLAAAYAPARQAARMDVVAALGGRRDQARTRRGWPIAGGVLIAGGVVLSMVGVRLFQEFGAALGAVAIIIGCVMIGPWVVGAAGRGAGWLPLPLRLAVRDGSRNRGRAAPAVAAIMAAVAGITALAIGGASDFDQNRQEYRERLPEGTTMIQAVSFTPGRPSAAGPVSQAIAREIPGVPVVPLRVLPGVNRVCLDEDTGKCPFVEFDHVYDGGETITIDTVVGGAREARLLLGRDDPAVNAALAAGKVVLFNVKPPPGGTVGVSVRHFVNDEDKVLRKVGPVPAVAVPQAANVRVLAPPSVAARAGIPAEVEAFGIDRADHRLTPDQQSRLQERVEGQGGGEVYTERGFTESFGQVLLFLGLAGALMVLGGSLIATGLSAADSRPDLATLAAVGARPRTRRLLMMGQAGFVAILGCWLGILAGLAPGIAVARPLTRAEGVEGRSLDAAGHGTIVAIPWELLAGIGVVVPLISMAAAGLCTRSRLPMARRVAG